MIAIPLLSACIPTYNGAATLARTLTALLAQRGVDLEIIVGDDASTDATLEVARRCRDRRLRIRAFGERKGIVDNWNRTLWLARGRYAAVVGQDDEVDAGWAESLVSLLEAHPDASLAFCRRRFAYDSDESRAAVGDFFSRQYPAILEAFYARTGTVIPTAIMLREAMVHDFEINLIGEPAFTVFRTGHEAARAGFDPAMYQMIDWEFHTRFFAQGPILHCPRLLGTYHIRAAGVSVDNARNLQRHFREYAHLLDVVLARFAALLGEEEKARLRQRRDDSLRNLASYR